VLRQFRKAHKLTQEELARILDIGRTWLARLETGEKPPSRKLQNRIKDTFARYEADKQLAGKLAERPMLSDRPLPARFKSRDIPVVSWAAAGKATDYQDLATQIDETVGSHVTDPNAFAVIVEGDSMNPEFKAGDRVVVAPNLEARTGDVVLAKLSKGGVLLKRFKRTGLSGQTIRLESDNPNYPATEFAAEEFTFVYPVMEFKRLMRW
jgi:SOS-response transcriptional repressor LexA